jgi:hypothetical protein
MELRRRVAAEVARLPKELRRLQPANTCALRISPGLHALAAECDRAYA